MIHPCAVTELAGEIRSPAVGHVALCLAAGMDERADATEAQPAAHQSRGPAIEPLAIANLTVNARPPAICPVVSCHGTAAGMARADLSDLQVTRDGDRLRAQLGFRAVPELAYFIEAPAECFVCRAYTAGMKPAYTHLTKLALAKYRDRLEASGGCAVPDFPTQIPPPAVDTVGDSQAAGDGLSRINLAKSMMARDSSRGEPRSRLVPLPSWPKVFRPQQ